MDATPNAYFNTIQQGQLERLTFLLRAPGLHINLQNAEGSTGLMLAIIHTHPEIIKYFLDQKANVTLKNKHGCTALMFAAHKGNTSVVKQLLFAGAKENINEKDEKGMTALMFACAMSKGREMVQALLAAKADPNLTDNEGHNAEYWAEKNGKTDVLDLLQGAPQAHQSTESSAVTSALHAPSPMVTFCYPPYNPAHLKIEITLPERRIPITLPVTDPQERDKVDSAVTAVSSTSP